MTDRAALEARAEARGVLTWYHDLHGRPCVADDEALSAVLDALGEPAAPAPGGPPAGAAWERADAPPDWGIFLPHHALHDANTRGLGDVSALRRLGAWAASRGASVLGTLPLLPTFLHTSGPYEPSPYAPVSRRFWGEHLVDPTLTPEWADCDAARARLQAAAEDGTLDRLRSGEHVDPQAAWALQRALLADLAALAWSDAERSEVLHDWALDDPERLLYAWFRTSTERDGAWPTWPEGSVDAALEDARVALEEDAAVRTWVYAQHAAATQLAWLRDELAADGIDLYLDLPIGVHPDGYDTWRATRGTFVSGASAGAPPDPYFPSGQDWGFPPLNPGRASALAHLAECVDAHAAIAHRLRLDHVMGFHRLYWVPRGLGARRGVYVRYPSAACWRILVEASHRRSCALIGENLGIVPDEVTEAMQRHRVRGMAVGQFALHADPQRPFHLPPPGVLASLNTHDTAPFAGWWSGRDLDDHEALGFLTPDRAAHERHWRGRTVEALAPLATEGPLADAPVSDALRVAATLYARLARSEARTVLVNLEDLWGEERPHNVPGTWRERPNWLRRSARALEHFVEDPHVNVVLADLRAARPR